MLIGLRISRIQRGIIEKLLQGRCLLPLVRYKLLGGTDQLLQVLYPGLAFLFVTLFLVSFLTVLSLQW